MTIPVLYLVKVKGNTTKWELIRASQLHIYPSNMYDIVRIEKVVAIETDLIVKEKQEHVEL